MKKFFSFVIKQHVATILAVVFILAFGVYVTVGMPINLLPDINVPMVCVQVIYPGANATSVESDVTEKLEEGLSSISGITGVDSYSYDNLSAVVLSFDYGTELKDKKADIQNKISSLTLPDGITASVYNIDLNAEALAVLSVTSGKGEDENEKLKNAYGAANELVAKIAALDGVESVEVKGGADPSYLITPFAGLELTAPLIVQALSYGALDLPLGNITENGGSVQIRNNSDIKTESDIYGTTVKLPSSVVTLLTSVKQVMRYYENATVEDLETLEADLGSGVITVLGEIDEMQAEDIRLLAKLKTYMNISSAYTAEQLKSFKRSRAYSEIYERVTNPPAEEGGERTPKSEEELKDLLEDIKSQNALLADYITLDMLKVIAEGKIDNVIAFREQYLENTELNPNYTPDSYYEPTNEDYYVMETQFVKVYSGAYDYANITEEERAELSARIDFAKKTSATGLATIADKKDGDPAYMPTDAECALLFAGTKLAADHPVITSSTFMAFVRSPHYTDNMAVLKAKRAEFGEKLTANDFNAVYSAMNLEGVFDFTLSEDLFGFILEADFTDLTNGEYVARLSRFARVTKEESFSSYVYYGNGEAKLIKGTVIEVYKSNGANSSAVVRAVKGVYDEYSGGNGKNYGADIALLDDQSEFISESIINVLVSMLIGGLLAVLIIFVFLKKVRTSLIIAVTMPLSVLAALICLSLMGITLNMVSLGGLAVGIGMLVDNSIVVIESITKHREMDKSAFEAAVDGTVEVGGALFGSTLTTVCVFIPIIFSGGLTGEIFTDLSWAVIYSLAFSLIIAVTVIPTLYALFGKRDGMLKGGRFKKTEPATAEEVKTETEEEKQKKPKKTFKEKVAVLKQPRLMDGVTAFYGKALPAVLNKKLVTIITAVVIFGGSVGLLFVTGTEFLPSIDKGQLEINMSYGSGMQLEEIQSDVFSFAEAVRENVENVDYVSVSVGKNGLLALTDTGIIKVQLTTNRGTAGVVSDIRALSESAEHKPRGTVTVREIDGVVASLMSGADDLSVTVVGKDGGVLSEIAEEISAKLALEENGFKDVKNSSTEKAVQYTLAFDRFKMAELGLDYQTAVLTLRIGIASYTACTATIDGEKFNLDVRFDEGAITDKNTLENFVVGFDASEGSAVKLKDILIGNGIAVEETEACIRRSNGKHMISVSATLPGTDTGTASKKMQKIAAEVLASKPEYAGYSFNSSGISSYLTDAFEGLAVALVISFFLLFAVMAVQFGSAVKPLIIMASIPFSFTGGFLALVMTGTSLNVVSFIGLIMLMGVVVNNAIVMLEKIKQLCDDGMRQYEAVQTACKERLRPILMTTLTTILALIPLAIGVGQGSELMQPLGIVVIGGLLLGTLVTLLLVPAVYCAVHGVSAKTPEGRRSAEKS